MGADALGAVTEYASDWIYFFLGFIFWLEVGVLSLFLAIQSGFEAEFFRKTQQKSTRVLLRLFMALLSLGLFGTSIWSLCGKTLSVSPNTYWSLGLRAARNGFHQKAIDYYRRAEAAGENASVFYLDFAESLHEGGNDPEALTVAKRSKTNSMQENLMVGRIYFSLQNYKQAKTFFEEAARKSPGDPLIFAWLGETYTKLDTKQEALSAYAKVLASPNLSSALRAQISKKIQMLSRP